jgi:hypothetical protein
MDLNHQHPGPEPEREISKALQVSHLQPEHAPKLAPSWSTWSTNVAGRKLCPGLMQYLAHRGRHEVGYVPILAFSSAKASAYLKASSRSCGVPAGLLMVAVARYSGGTMRPQGRQ